MAGELAVVGLELWFDVSGFQLKPARSSMVAADEWGYFRDGEF